MPNQEIPREYWSRFFEGFSEQHDGWLATVEAVDSDIGAQTEADRRPLQGVTLDPKGSHHGTIKILIGTTPDDHVAHTITAPAHVWLKQSAQWADEAVAVESADGRKTILRIYPP